MQISKFFESHLVLKDAEFARTGPFNSTAKSTLSFAEQERYLRRALDNPAVCAVIVPEGLAEIPLVRGHGVVVSDTPRETFFETHNALARQSRNAGVPARIAVSAYVAPTARISSGCVVEAGAHISDFAYLAENTIIEEDCFVGETAVVGASGHFEQRSGRRRLRVEHVGWVRVQQGAQILAGAIVQKDVFAQETTIGRDAVIGPGVRVAHGVTVGEDSVLTGGTVVAGYTKIGDRVWIGPGSVIGNNLTIGDGARIEIGSTVIQSVKDGARMSGNFAMDHTRNLRLWQQNRTSG